MNDNFAPSIQEKQNTNFMEERIVNQHLAYPSSQATLSPFVSKEMADGFWSIKDQLKKPVLISTLSWSPTDERGKILANYSVPGVLANSESLIRQTLQLYAFYRMSFTFRIQINATQFNGGQLIACFDPFTLSHTTPPTQKLLNYAYTSHFYATGLPHVKIQASESDAVELTIPFISPKSFLTTNDPYAFNNLGAFRILVMNPLTIPEGAQNNVTISTWLYAVDAEVNVPIGTHEVYLEPTSGILPSLGQSLGSAIGGKKLGKIGNDLGKMGNLLTGNVGQAFDIAGGLASGLKDLMLDYPADPIAPPKTISPLENLAIAKGKSRSLRLSLDPNSLHQLDDETAGENLDSMNLKAIISKPMLITQAQFKFTDEPRKLLFRLPIHPANAPGLFIYRDDKSNPINILRQHTYLSHVSQAFTYWNGGINFDIEIVATRFHTGKLLFAYIPNTASSIGFGLASSNCPNVIIDIQQTSHFTFTIPFTSATPMKLTNLSTDDQANQSDVLNGTLVCYVLNHLNFPSNVASMIEINVYQSAASDFNFYVPRKPLWDTYITAPPTLEATSGISLISDGNEPSSTQVVLSKDQSISVPRKHFGEEYSLIDLIRRFSYLFHADRNFKDNRTQIVKISNIPSYIVPYALQTSYLSYFSKLYSAWSGTIRYKMVTTENRSSNASLTAIHYPDFDLATQMLAYDYREYLAITQGYATARTNLAQDNSLEIEAPYYSPLNMLILYSTLNIPNRYNLNGLVYGILQLPSTADVNIPIDVYHAAGEDFRFVFLRPPPLDNSNTKQFYIQPLITDFTPPP